MFTLGYLFAFEKNLFQERLKKTLRNWIN